MHVKRIVILAIICGATGLVIGYLAFGKIGNQYIGIGAILGFSTNIFEEIGNAIVKATKIRQSIAVSGIIGLAVGAAVGIVLDLTSGKKRRKKRR